MLSFKILKAGCAVVTCAFSASTFAAAPAPADPQPGVWQKHDYNFQYLGFTTTYSCDGLASKLKVLLLASGARADAKSTSNGCAHGFGVPDKFARARLVFYTLAPVANGENSTAPINGAWRSVAFADLSPREVRLGDCELVEQFRDKVLPLFTTRNVDNRMTCVPNQVSGSVVNLKFEAFAAVAAGKRK
jgi:hypothetical protein